ncbi:MAG: hypothetical protein A2511_09240 [Deltaproteobacteria bacterium RIFOXYD12_FULL_50_9]|nr:MAG: hypothetical protein A2511_09240 [Deltaproteobacteria bacterium RIFOXYD12_FULL_50_9]
MRNTLSLLLVILTLAGCGEAPLPSSSPIIPQMKMAGEYKANEPQALAVDLQGRIYVGQSDGAVMAFDQTGAKVLTLAATDANGKQLLKNPTGIAVNRDTIYVTDSDLQRIAVFNMEGRFLYSFGEKGGDAKEFKSPQAIAVHDNVVYVADTDNGRIQVFGANGVFLNSFNGDGRDVPPEKQLSEPIAIAVGPQGHLYIIDADDQRLKIFTAAGKFVEALPPIVKAAALAMTSDGFLLAETNSYSIKKFNFDNKLLFSFGSFGDGRAQFTTITGLAADNKGNVYAADRKRGLVQAFALEIGQPYPDWRRPPPPTSVRWLRSIVTVAEKTAWDDKENTLYAIDRETKNILLFKDGETVGTLTVPASTINALAVDATGSLWAVDSNNKRLLKLDRQGKILLTVGSSGSGAGNFSKPTDIAISSDGLIYVTDRGNRRVQTFNAEGVFMNAFSTGKDGLPLDSPIAISVSPDNTVYVLDKGSKLITAFSASGQVLLAFGGKEKEPENLDDPVDLYANGQEVQVLDAGTKNIKVYSTAGKLIRQFSCSGNESGDLHKPTAITGMTDNSFAVSDTGNNRIQIFTTVLTPSLPVKFSAAPGMRTIALTWQKNPEPYGITYRISKSEQENGPFTTLAEVKEERYNDRDVKPKQIYYYLLTALAESGNQCSSDNIVSATPNTYVPTAPGGLTAQTKEWSVTLNWDANQAGFFSHFLIYRQVKEERKLVGKSLTPTFIEKSLSPNTTYNYMVSAVSIDEEESPVTALSATTIVATKPPVEINVIEMSNIFSNTYKLYEERGLGKIKITNNLGDPISKLKLSFTIKDMMDFPWETEILELGPDMSQEFVLKAVFNNNILTVTEDTPVQTEIKATYFENNQLKTFNRNHTITIYEKHRLMWDVRDRFATFITPKDPLILDFTRAVVSQFGTNAVIIQQAAALFDALSLLGLTYMQDPSNPYQVTSGKIDMVDYIQYPRETLQRKSGDCDDLTALYCAALESLGIRTLVVEVPGHMFMMLATGIEADEKTDTMNNLFIIYDNQLWIPVETTLVGGPFVRAWEQGSSTYLKWMDKKSLTLLDIRGGWGTFKPASLPNVAWRPPEISRTNIEGKFPDDFRTIRKLSTRLNSRKYFDRLATNPADTQALLQIGIIYAKAGEAEEALVAFVKIIATEPGNAAAQNNAGNIYFILNRLEEACAAYNIAGENDPQDPLIWVNLARCYRSLSQLDKAKEAFLKAQALDQNVAQQYRTLSLELQSVL